MNPVFASQGGVNPWVLVFAGSFLWVASLPAQQQGETKITAVRNQVSKSTTATNTPADVGHAVKAGESVATGSQGLVEFKSTDSTTVRLGENSRASYDPATRKVKLDRGTLVVDSPPEGGPMKVEVNGVTYTLTMERSESDKTESTPKTGAVNKSQSDKKSGEVLQKQNGENSK